LEADIYPAFLQEHTFYNLTSLGLYLRLFAGLALLWVGLSLGYTFIFLDTSRVLRLWVCAYRSLQVVLPFTLALYMLVSYMYGVDPVLACLGMYEFKLLQVRTIQEPIIKGMHRRHSSVCAALMVAGAAAFTVLFVLVPGHRL